ncbi:MAG: glycosyltransferase [Anaerolineales bacterium]|nr:glycosyltransferase [Anaerolineales bacterium]
MACGTPVVGVREGGVRETLLHNETGLLTERDPRQFADAVLGLLTNPISVDALGRLGPSYVQEHWSWDATVAQVEAHLKAVTSQCR